LLAEVLETQSELVGDFLANFAGDENASWLSQSLQPCSDVDPVAIEIAALNYDVAEIDSDTQDNSPVLRQAGVGRFHGLL
jgi:hypothetical protein